MLLWPVLWYAATYSQKMDLDFSPLIRLQLYSFTNTTVLYKTMHKYIENANKIIYRVICTDRYWGLTKLPQKRQGPDPSCSQTMRPHVMQLLMRLCFCARHSQACRPGKRIARRSWPSFAYRFTYLGFFFPEDELLFSCACKKHDCQSMETSNMTLAVFGSSFDSYLE